MAPAISIVGGNIAGLSAAYYLARRGFTVTVYESRLWNKPCGGAISREFAQFLQTELGVFPEGIDYFVPGLRFAFTQDRTFDNKNFFVVVSRYELQKRLMERLSASPDIDIVFRQVRMADRELFTPQTIVATGYGGFARKVMGEHWHRLHSGLIFRYDGKAPGSRHPNRHLMVFESRLKGYGWVFIGKDDHVNIGVGGMTDRASIKQAYYDFFDVIADRYGYHMRVDNREPAAWKIPVLAKNWAHPVAYRKDGVEFIGAGDVLGLAHPIIGAGIEPAWQSGWLLAESVDAEGEK
ncbi:MAG: NAD(P)/FAD-dependent oxidoreductase, partial [Thermodesulfobacteriota bacterium]